MTEIYIISGFLGAGKTTLIQKLLTEAFPEKKIALVENDFGEVSVDAALLKGGGYQVKELNTGCICCTLTGDFIAALHSLLKSYHPDVVLIEPSGVGKLSDVEKACQAIPQADILGKITVVDVKRCQSYLENFGEFFEDQVIHADTILFSRTASFPDRIPEAAKVVRALNPHAVLFTEEWETIPAHRLLGEADSDLRAPAERDATPCAESGLSNDTSGHSDECHKCHTSSRDAYNHTSSHDAHDHTSSRDAHDHTEECHSGGGHQECCDHSGSHDHSHRDDCSDQQHGHTAAEVFDTLTLHFRGEVRLPVIAARISSLEAPEYGMVLRAKGILQCKEGFCNLQFLPGDLKLEQTDVRGNELCIIGRDLNEARISALFADA